MVLGDNRSKQGGAGCLASVICFQKIFGLYGLNHQIIEYWVSVRLTDCAMSDWLAVLAVLVGTRWYWVSFGGFTGRYLVILNQNSAVLVALPV